MLLCQPLSLLEIVTLMSNNLHCTLPSSLGKLTQLNTLQLGLNYLTGPSLESLSDLYIVKGTIASSLSIESIPFNDNCFTGTIADGC
jgi:hypothetical protein